MSVGRSSQIVSQNLKRDDECFPPVTCRVRKFIDRWGGLRMKVYISVDMEGSAGIVDELHLLPQGGSEFSLACRLLTAEVNAAIEGAFEGGATEVVVNDGHEEMRNLDPEALHPDARLIQGKIKPAHMVEGLDDTFDAAFLVGYHAPSGVRDGVLNHTFHPYTFRCNGEVWGEIAFNSSVAGHYGVPVVLVVGDDAAVRNAQETLPSHVGVSVKRGITRLAGESLHPSRAQELIRQGAKDAMAKVDQIQPFKVKTPVTVEMDLYFSQQADVATLIPTVERVADRTIRFTADNAKEAHRTFVATNIINRNLL
jgi:D-amino peptidase